MKYSKTYFVKDEHIDLQGIVDGLYYPFYMEDCRHSFIRDELSFDFKIQAQEGVFMVLSKYTIEFVRSLKKYDEFTVNCEVFRDANSPVTLHFKQQITRAGKLMTKAVFSGTCIPASGGRPFLPGKLIGLLDSVPFL